MLLALKTPTQKFNARLIDYSPIGNKMYFLGHLGITARQAHKESKGLHCTDPSGKGPHRQAGLDLIVTLERLGGVMVRTFDRNAREVASIPALSAHLHHPMTQPIVYAIMLASSHTSMW